MSDRYYLLRNNREAGPYLLDELLQQCLLPGDLVWVEGRSQYWHEPSDVPEVEAALPKGYSLSPVKQHSPTVTEHFSDRELALRAESIRRRALAALYQQVPLHQAPARPDIPTGPVYLREEDAVEIVQHKAPATRSNVAEFMLFCTLSSLVVLGWRSGIFAHIVQVRPQVSSEATQMVSESANAASATARPVQQSGFLLPQVKPQPLAVSDSLRTDSTAPAKTIATARPRPAAPKRNTVSDSGTLAINPQPPSGSKVIDSAPAGTEPLRDANKTAIVPEKTDKPEKDIAEKPKVKDDASAATDSKSLPVAEVKEEKPKGLGLFRGLFKKKKKDEAAAPASDN